MEQTDLGAKNTFEWILDGRAGNPKFSLQDDFLSENSAKPQDISLFNGWVRNIGPVGKLPSPHFSKEAAEAAAAALAVALAV